MLVQGRGAVGPISMPVQKTQYEQLLHNLQHDTRWLHELSLGKRVGYYRFSNDIGSGNFSHVKLAVHQLTRDKVAIKIIDKSKLDTKTRKMLAREIATMEAVHHPNIIRLFEVVDTYSKIHLVTEYAPDGELFNKISMEGRLDESVAKKLYSQVLHAVKHMHSKGFIHRDIKAENVFYASPTVVKLGDFGFSTQLTNGMWQPLNTFCGSPPYAAPELFRDENYIGQLVDVWALGILLYFMVTGTMPFRAHSVAALKNFILEGKYQIPGFVSDQCCYIIEHTLIQAPKQRLTIDEILACDWFKSPPTPAPDPSRRRKSSLFVLATKFRRGSSPLSPNNKITDEQLAMKNSYRKCSTTLQPEALRNLNRNKVNGTLNNNNNKPPGNGGNAITSIAEETKINGDVNPIVIPKNKKKLLTNNIKGQSFDVQMLPSSKPAENLKCADGTPVEQGRFIMLPTCTNDLTFLNPLEVKTREKLNNYGIASKMLCDSIGQNSKSPIIGIYRVVMHRVLTEEYIWDSLSNPTTLVGKKQSEKCKKTTENKRTLRQKISRTCVIL